jgi:hypothetical protein
VIPTAARFQARVLFLPGRGWESLTAYYVKIIRLDAALKLLKIANVLERFAGSAVGGFQISR